MTDLRKAVAKPFQIEGEELQPKEFKKVLSFDTGWFEPAEASEIVEKALRRGLVEEDEEGTLTPAFDYEDVDIPLEFAPAVESGEDSLEDAMADRAAELLDKERGEVIAGANRLRRESEDLLSIEAAIAVHALEEGARMPELAGRAAEELRKG